jgi:pyruvate kinase
VIQTLDALIVTLRRLTGETNVPYPPPALARAAASELEAEAERIFGKRPKGAPRVRVMATLPPEAATQPELVDNLIAAGMDCARINCAHDDAEAWDRMVANVREAASRLERPCKILMDLAGPKCRIQKVKAPPKTRLMRGDRVTLIDEVKDKTKDPIAFSLNFPELVDQLAVGAEVFIDDGKAAGRVVAKHAGRAEIEIYGAREKGVRLKPGKGINFPTTELDLPPLTSKDFGDLDFIAGHADLVGFSFVQRVDDIELLQDHLVARAPRREPHAIVLKIETPLAVRNLPQLILQSATHNPTAVMIARGDLAVELGFARLTEMQEEILWLCEAAHTPVVWATQVLDNYVRDGMASRAEMIDAATAQGAECVMLNKGPYLAEGVAFLRDVLSRMDRHFSKKFVRFGSLKEWS